MRNILIVEDDLERIDQFRASFSGDNVVHAATAQEAITLLEEYTWDWLFLDHDLGGEVMVDSFSDKNTGYTVAVWLEEHVNEQPPKIIIHSFNPQGAANINKAIPEAVKLPGAWMYKLDRIEKELRLGQRKS